jgi:hypothetical protein
VDTLITTARAHPVLLWVGPQATTHEHAQHLFQKIFCPHNGCTTCTTCLQIQQRQYHAISWFSPERQYLVDDMDAILEQLTFSLEIGEHRFLVLDRTESLTLATANRLLKSLEEPPAGYHFLLLTEHLQAILPTIRSRALVHQWQETQTNLAYNAYVSLFTQNSHPHLATFTELLETQPLTEQDTIRALDEILEVVMTRRKHEITQGTLHPTTEQTLNRLLGMAKHPPMPGSSKLFWKNLYLQLSGQT